MGYWQGEYEDNGWRDYVDHVISSRHGQAMRDYEVTDEDKRQVEHLLAVLNDDMADESFVYHTPCSDLSFEYNTPGTIDILSIHEHMRIGPQKKKRPGSCNSSKVNNTSFFPDYTSQELQPCEADNDKVASSLCQRLADLSPITMHGIASVAQKLDFDRTLSFDDADDGGMNHLMAGGDAMDGVEHDASVTELHAPSAVRPSYDKDDVNMEEAEQVEEFEELDVQQPPDEIASGMEWTMLLDHFDIRDVASDKESPSALDDVPTQRRHSGNDFDFAADRKLKPPPRRRRRLRVPDSPPPSNASDVSFGGASDTSPAKQPNHTRRQPVPPSSFSDISSIDDSYTCSRLDDTPPCSTVESTAGLHLARVSSGRGSDVAPLTLHRHQQHAVEWMQSREQSAAKPFRGGILADEMGLGKTVCCLALVASTNTRQKKQQRKRPTLIITPLSLVHQWEQEIKDKSTLSVGLYHGASRKRFHNSHELYAFDVILTTYDTLRIKEAAYTRPTMAAVRNAKTVSQVYFASSRRWIQTKRSRDGKPLASKLHKVYWERVILDEAHLISNSVTARAQAACQLSARARWCVTGTPIQNRLDDVHTLFRFLGLPAVESDVHLEQLLEQCMLRRLKTALPVALPTKTEHLLKLTFATDAEIAWYAAVHQSTRDQVHEHLQARRPGRHIFELLLRLRQVCNSPRLVPQDHTSPSTVHMSTKMHVLFDHLQRAKKEGAAVLVISQWTSFLDMIQDQLDVTNPAIRCGRLDGRMSAAVCILPMMLIM
ncbi:hypothetical protein DYB36_001650 [Aphanomyces astaci]|uniref:Helicase ATP-binding domain-containing protein n=1 Tax=Aphanomyces astaci TaxID=112090 RepID=A0A397AW99_APHAT|nr:hypothetical protein DYB36_001650 [Aphanomyces astaci]